MDTGREQMMMDQQGSSCVSTKYNGIGLHYDNQLLQDRDLSIVMDFASFCRFVSKILLRC